MCFSPQRLAIFRHRELQKVVRTWRVLRIFTWKCVSRHSGRAILDIRTSKSALRPSTFCILTSKCASRHSGLKFFHIRTSKSGPTPDVFCANFYLKTRFLAIAACNFWLLLWPHDSAPAALRSLLFRLTRHTNHWKKTQHFATSLTFGAAWIFFLLTFAAIASSFSGLYFISSAFHLLFNSPYCRKFTI